MFQKKMHLVIALCLLQFLFQFYNIKSNQVAEHIIKYQMFSFKHWFAVFISTCGKNLSLYCASSFLFMWRRSLYCNLFELIVFCVCEKESRYCTEQRCDYGGPEGDCVWCAAQVEITNGHNHINQATTLPPNGSKHTTKTVEALCAPLWVNVSFSTNRHTT